MEAVTERVWRPWLCKHGGHDWVIFEMHLEAMMERDWRSTWTQSMDTHCIIPSSLSHTLLPSIHRSTHHVWFLAHSCQVFTDPGNSCGSSWLGNPWCQLTLSQCSLSQNHSFSRMPFGSHVGCGRVSMMGCMPSSSSVSPHCDWVNVELHSRAVIEWVWRPWSYGIGGRNRVSLETHLEAVIEWGWRCTWRLWLSEAGDALGGRDYEYLEAIMVQV